MKNLKMIEKPFVLLFLLCLLPLGVSAQSIVKGIVTDPSGEPVIGATVKVDGSKLGVVTDLDGKFSVDAAPDATLTITYVGMEPKTVKAEAGKTLSITLKDDSKVLNDVVVIGSLLSGQQSKRSHRPGDTGAMTPRLPQWRQNKQIGTEIKE